MNRKERFMKDAQTKKKNLRFYAEFRSFRESDTEKGTGILPSLVFGFFVADYMSWVK